MSAPGVPFVSVAELAARVPDGAKLAVPTDGNGAPMALIRALIRRRARHLHLVNCPASGHPTDLLVGADAVDVVETSGVSLNEYGPAPAFVRAVKGGRVRPVDATCPAMLAAFRAGEMGIPFIPLRGIIGSDLLGVRAADWRTVDNPFAEDDPIVLLKALNPDVAILHAALADRAGNVWVGRRADVRTMVHASRRALVTFEAFHDGDLLADERYAAGTIPAIYVEALAEAPRGAWPCAFWHPVQAIDEAHMRRYAELARTEEGLRRYLDEFVFARELAA